MVRKGNGIKQISKNGLEADRNAQWVKHLQPRQSSIPEVHLVEE